VELESQARTWRISTACGLSPPNFLGRGLLSRCGGPEMDELNDQGSGDRSKINMHEVFEVKYWTKELGVSKEHLQKAVDKVGNSAAAVRKELGVLGKSH
jgi:hypothetical protein